MVAAPGAAAERGWIDRVQAWRHLGATHLSIDTMRLGLPDVESHISLLERLHTTARRGSPNPDGQRQRQVPTRYSLSTSMKPRLM